MRTGLCGWNQRGSSRLAAAATLVGCGLDCLYTVGRLAAAAKQGGIHHRVGALFFLGALMVQVRGSNDTDQPDTDQPDGPRFADGTEVTVTAHVTKEGTLQQDNEPGSFRQRIDVETEQIARGDEDFAARSGLRVNVYQRPVKGQADEAGAAPVHLFTYGERLREGIVGTVRWLGGLRVADVRVPTPGTALILLSALSIALAMALVRRRPALAICGLAALAASAFWISAVPPHPRIRPAVLEMTAIDGGRVTRSFWCPRSAALYWWTREGYRAGCIRIWISAKT